MKLSCDKKAIWLSANVDLFSIMEMKFEIQNLAKHCAFEINSKNFKTSNEEEFDHVLTDYEKSVYEVPPKK